MSAETGFADAALVRVAGVPIEWWLGAANPGVFGLLRELDDAECRYRRLAASVADRLGAELVPVAGLTARQRARVLAARRTLHNGGCPTDQELTELAALASRSLAGELGRLTELIAMLSALRVRAGEAVAGEEARLPGAAWELTHASPVASAALRLANPDAYHDIGQRLARGETWSSKRLRQRADYLWRMLTRGATKTTPRGLFAHVAVVGVGERPPAGRLVPAEVGPRLTLHRLENLHLARPDLGAVAPDLMVAFAPLHLDDGDALRLWVVDGEDADTLTEVTLRRTPILETVRAALPGRPRRVDEVEEALLAGGTDGQRPRVRAFLSRLAALGVLQVSRPLAESIVEWSGPARTAPVVVADERAGDFVDVYRQAGGVLSRHEVAVVAEAARQAMRLAALKRADADGRPPPVLAGLDDRPRPVLEVAAANLAAESAAGHGHDHVGGGAPIHPDSGYARLLAELAGSTGVVDIPPELLTGFGAPDPPLSWPVDLLLRPVASGGALAVLESVGPAGIVDARFADGADRISGGLPAVRAYRDFLDVLERRTGRTLVELLVPPLSERAANAVRRPLYTGAWTGDPDLATYCRADVDAARYVPLRDITVRRCGDRVLAEVHGAPIWPMYHATRVVPGVWRSLTKVLRAATPRPVPPLPGRGWLRWAFPDRAATPRITVGGALVVACAQWRVGPEALWPPGASTLEMARAVDRLRARLALPRWVMVRHAAGHGAYPCDLESLRSTRVLGRAAESGGGVVLEEMLPAPDQLLIADPVHPTGGRLAAQLILRLPVAESPAAMAERVAAAVGAPEGSPVPR